MRSWLGLLCTCLLLGLLGQVTAAGEPKTVQTKFRSNQKGLVTRAVPVSSTGSVVAGSTGTLDAKYFELSSGFDPVLFAMAKFEELSADRPFTSDRELEKLLAKSKANRESESLRDGRLPIDDPGVTPWIWNCLLIIEYENGEKGAGTGFLVGPRTVITQALNIHGGPGRGFHKRIEVIPGASPGNRPVGTFLGRELLVPDEWTTRADLTKDNYGAIILGSAVGNRIGYFGFANLSPRELAAERATIAGYSFIQPIGNKFPTQYRVGTDISVRPDFLMLKTPLSETFTGAPVFRRYQNERVVIGIQNFGSSLGMGATRINSTVHANLEAWKNHSNP